MVEELFLVCGKAQVLAVSDPRSESLGLEIGVQDGLQCYTLVQLLQRVVSS